MATNTSTTGRDSDKFMLRFPDGMRDRIAEAAKANNRSMNAEIVARLENSFSLGATMLTLSAVRGGNTQPTLLTATPEELAKMIARELKSQEKGGDTP